MSEFRKKMAGVGRSVYSRPGDDGRKEAWAFTEGAEYGAKEILNWAQQLCGSGMTVGMIRARLYNRFIEIDGKGEKA